MFTGIVTDVGRDCSGRRDPREPLKRLRIRCILRPRRHRARRLDRLRRPLPDGGRRRPREGGCWFDVDAAAETLERTTVGDWQAGTQVNLERSLKIGDELGGHIVTGHVDGLATIVARRRSRRGDDPWGPTARFDIKAPPALAQFIAEKGSVCLDGTSLTVNSVDDDMFSVLIIPHTLTVTTWGERQAGDKLNLEVDLMARYAARLADARRRE